MKFHNPWISCGLTAVLCLVFVGCKSQSKPDTNASSPAAAPPSAPAPAKPDKPWRIRLGIKAKGSVDKPLIESHGGTYNGAPKGCSAVEKDGKGSLRCYISW